jgi:hypothetical protein
MFISAEDAATIPASQAPPGEPMTLGNMRGERGLKLTQGSIDGHL